MGFLHSDFENINCYSKNVYSEASQTPITNCVEHGIEPNEPDHKGTEERKGRYTEGPGKQMDNVIPIN